MSYTVDKFGKKHYYMKAETIQLGITMQGQGKQEKRGLFGTVKHLLRRAAELVSGDNLRRMR